MTAVVLAETLISLVKSPTTLIERGLMKTPRRGLQALRFRQITIQYQERSRQAKRL